MAKAKQSLFFCKECGYETSKWAGQCPACRQWNTMVEEPAGKSSPSSKSSSRIKGRAVPALLSEISVDEQDRMSTGFKELDRVLGDGIVIGSLVLVGGDPGIGKSTILLQVCRNLAKEGRQILYISGEESLKQIKLRANRIGKVEGELRFLCETNVGDIREIIEERKPEIVVIDSIQTMFMEDITSAPGSVSQVRECANVFLQIAKGLGTAVFLVGHVTKEGVVAGPRVLEHMVDTVLYFEGERTASYRILRAVKNRFGSTNEIGVFEMMEEGLCEVENPSEFLLSGRPEDASGAVVACLMEGTRPILLEVQALVTESNFGLARRTAAGADYNRINLLMAVLEKRCRYDLGKFDAYVNIAGGLRMNEPAMDLAIILALISSYKDKPMDPLTVIFGEVGLAGEVRAVSMADHRVYEAKKLGFTTCVLPRLCLEKIKPMEGIRMIGVSNVREAISAVL